MTGNVYGIAKHQSGAHCQDTTLMYLVFSHPKFRVGFSDEIAGFRRELRHGRLCLHVLESKCY